MYYFIGIKGAGMSALAVILKKLGNTVIGSDIDKHFFTEEELIKIMKIGERSTYYCPNCQKNKEHQNG